jgi:hypothetical protein
MLLALLLERKIVKGGVFEELSHWFGSVENRFIENRLRNEQENAFTAR